MDFFRPRPRGPPASSALQQAPPPRVQTPSGRRLSVILETNPGSRPPTPPPRSSKRISNGASIATDGRHSAMSGNTVVPLTRPSSRSSWVSNTPTIVPTKVGTGRENAYVPPGVHRWVSGASKGAASADMEKVDDSGVHFRMAQRGGWRRVLIIAIVLICVAIALGVGLGLGLSRKSHSASSAATTSTGSSSESNTRLAFPVGEYSLSTALMDVSTNCTSNSATWRCYPYSIYPQSDSSTASTSRVDYNWVLSNTSATYADNTTTLVTTDSGVPANLSISASDDPFAAITFSNMSLTYINDNSRPRYTFSYTMSQQTIPSTNLTSDNTASICYFNDTVVTVTLYLTDTVAVDYPPAALADSTSYTSWPYAVRVEQTAAGGANVPACYEYTNGVVGNRIQDGLTQEASDEQCVCDYRNYAA